MLNGQETLKTTPRRVLVVDDSKVNQFMACALLKKENIHAETANDGIHALEILSEQSFDLILMDLEMPNLGGLDTIVEIRRRKESGVLLHAPSIVILSARDPEEVQIPHPDLRLNGYLRKPLSPQEMRLIHAVLENPQGTFVYNNWVELQNKILNHATLHILEEALGRETLALVVGKALVDIPPLEKDVVGHLDAGTTQDATVSLFSLKGIALNVGADMLAATCGLLNDELRIKDPLPLSVEHILVTQLRSTVKQTLKELEKHQANLDRIPLLPKKTLWSFL